jgi:hypothetical protein
MPMATAARKTFLHGLDLTWRAHAPFEICLSVRQIAACAQRYAIRGPRPA